VIIHPGSREEWLKLRHSCVSSTEVPALFGMSPYITAFELAIGKEQPEPTELELGERAEWGLYMERPIAQKFADDYGVKVRKLDSYAVKQEVGIGASFDFEIVGLKDTAPAGPVLQGLYTNLGAGVMEIKTVDFLIWRDQWPDRDGMQEAPAHIELQVQAQLHCLDRKWAAICVLVGGNTGKLLIRERDEDVGKAIEAKVSAFWRDLRQGKRPPISLPDDAEIIRKIYSYAEPGKVLDAQADAEMRAICLEYENARLAATDAENKRKSAQAKLLQKIGDAEKVLVEGYTISAGMIAPTWIERYERKGYRNIRVTAKKEKAA